MSGFRWMVPMRESKIVGKGNRVQDHSWEEAKTVL